MGGLVNISPLEIKAHLTLFPSRVESAFTSSLDFSFTFISVYVKAFEGKKIVQIACGQQHSIALDSQGFVHVWGYNGYCRLGLGNQQDVLTPKVVPQVSRLPSNHSRRLILFDSLLARPK
jgi:alpha-tubulin suppressor-like RCC1 family protein